MHVQRRPDPMRLYVLWHPDCASGADFAREIYLWFRGDPGDITQSGYGIPVLYRSKPFQADAETPRAIDLSAARLNIIVPLVDQHMVVSTAWRRYLRSLADSETSRDTACLMCPVALDPAAYHLPENVSRLNFLRVDRVTDPDIWDSAKRLHVRRQRLLSLLTQVCCRLLWGSHGGAGPLALDMPSLPLHVFISHAKADGTDIAEAIRDQIYHQGQLQAFFDESDLAIGYAFEQALNKSAQHETAAMMAVFTDAYASRPWCRRELRLAREPVIVVPTLPEPSAAAPMSYGRVKPLMIVDALRNGYTHFLPEFGYAPVVRWHPERVTLLIDRLLREVLLYGYHEERAKALPGKPGRYGLNCIPDLQMILQLWHNTHRGLQEVIIPPPGLPLSEQAELKKFFVDLEIKIFDDIAGEQYGCISTR